MKYRLINKNVLAILLMVVGGIIIVYPGMRNFYYDAKQQAIMEDYLESMSAIATIDDEVNQDINLSESNTIEPIIPHIQHVENKTEHQGENPKSLELNKKWPVEATLMIEKIDLLMPVIKGASIDHLNVSIASIDHTGKPWEGSNYVISGHRSRKFGRHFNRLDELEINDEMKVIDTKNNEFIYRVFSKEIVQENDLSVLENSNESELTLITCDPINAKKPTHRLIIKGQLIENKN